MRTKSLLFILSFLVITISLNAAVVIPKTAVWKYKADGSNQGTAWRTTTFNDATWASGAAELGYGDSPVTTLTASKITYYFRNTVNITNPSQFTNFTINLRRDDGIVVYVNGTEVIRNNMPTGTISYTTISSTNCSDDGNTIFTFTLPSSTFVNGTNVIAAEVHNTATTSSDLTFELELLSNLAGIPTITRGPYIQSTTAGTTILKWRTNTACDTKVQWGSTTAYGNSKTDAALVTDHEVQITGLAANTKYFYSIGTTTAVIQGNTANFLWTAPTTGSTQKVRVWAIGDFGVGTAAQQSVVNSYVSYLGANKNDMWLWLGDNAYNTGTDAEYQSNVFNIYGNQFKSWNFYPALGNHDYGNVGYKSTSALGTGFPYFSIFNLPTTGQAGGISSGTEKYYSYNWGNIHFIALDSYGAQNNSTSPMYTWLQNDLAANTQKWTIVYWHHPPYSKGTHNSDTETELIDMRTNIVPLLETYKVDLVLNGHSHTYERSYFMHGHYGLESTFNSSMIVQAGDGNAVPYVKDATHNGTIYAVCGVGGQSSSSTTNGYPHNAMIKSFTSLNGSVALEITGDTMVYKFLKSDGTIPDQFKMIKPSTPRLSFQLNGSLINELNIYPNPSNGIINIKTGLMELTSIEIYDELGKLVFTDEVYNEKSFDLSNYANGEYIIVAKTNENSTTRKIILEK